VTGVRVRELGLVFRPLVLVVRSVPLTSIPFDVIPMVRGGAVVLQPVVVVQMVDWEG